MSNDLTKIQKEVKSCFINTLSPEDLNKKLSEAWLGVLVNDHTIFNPLERIPAGAHDKFSEYLVWLMGQPDYFYFLIKIILQMESYPMQCLILKELFNHKFPILLGGRGLAKSTSIAIYLLMKMIITPGCKCVVTGAGFRQAKVVFDYMEQIWIKSPMLRNCFRGSKNGPVHGTDVWTFRLGDSITYALPVGPDGSKIRGYRANVLVNDEFSCLGYNSIVGTDLGLLKIGDIVENKINCSVYNKDGILEPVINYIKTPLTDVYKLTTKYNYEIEFSDKHKFMIADGSWKLGKDLTTEDFIIFDDNYKFPNTVLKSYKGIKSEDMAFLYGLLVSEGDVSGKYIVSIGSINKDLIDDLMNRFKVLNPKVYITDAYIDNRGWNCKKKYSFCIHSKDFRDFLVTQGIHYSNVYNKEIPFSILQSNRSCVLSFLRGLFIGYGSVFLWSNHSSKKIGVAYYSVCKKLIDQIHILLKSLGYIAYKNNRDSKLSDKKQWFLRLNGTYAADFATEIDYPDIEKIKSLITPFKDKFRVRDGSLCLNKNKKYTASVHYNGKRIYLGSFVDQNAAKNKIDEFEKNRKLCVQVKKIEKLEKKECLYDISLPDTHSYYANGLVSHNSANRTTFEEVMSGFLAVSASPVEQVKHRSTLFAKKKLFIPISTQDEESGIIQNQLILSGTAYYKFNHFYQYFTKWRDIIYSGGDVDKLRTILGEDDNDLSNFNWKNYSIIRIPVELAPPGFMDMDQINRNKASTSKDVFLREYNCVFSDDSDGFFKRSLINACTASESNPIIKEEQEVKFAPMLYGDKSKKYVYGVDPAYQGDNFAIVILEINKSHRRVVHVWTTQASDHKQRLKAGLITENDYYHYCVRKLRTLMKRFPCAYMALDALGGGRAIIEAFTDVTKLEEGELMVLPVINRDEKPQDTDFIEGDHIIQIINFTSNWISEANHSLKKDMEARDIIFPYHDALTYTLSEFYDQSLGEAGQLYDTLEDCVFEIEELKKELSIITITETSTGRERFDTPELKTGIAKKGRLRKDRYSALLMANWVARTADIFTVRPLGPDLMTMSGFVDLKNPNCMFNNTSPIAKSLNDLYS